jgi:hypothetical protein
VKVGRSQLYRFARQKAAVQKSQNRKTALVLVGNLTSPMLAGKGLDWRVVKVTVPGLQPLHADDRFAHLETGFFLSNHISPRSNLGPTLAIHDGRFYASHPVLGHHWNARQGGFKIEQMEAAYLAPFPKSWSYCWVGYRDSRGAA